MLKLISGETLNNAEDCHYYMRQKAKKPETVDWLVNRVFTRNNYPVPEPEAYGRYVRELSKKPLFKTHAEFLEAAIRRKKELKGNKGSFE